MVSRFPEFGALFSAKYPGSLRVQFERRRPPRPRAAADSVRWALTVHGSAESGKDPGYLTREERKCASNSGTRGAGDFDDHPTHASRTQARFFLARRRSGIFTAVVVRDAHPTPCSLARAAPVAPEDKTAGVPDVCRAKNARVKFRGLYRAPGAHGIELLPYYAFEITVGALVARKKIGAVGGGACAETSPQTALLNYLNSVRKVMNYFLKYFGLPGWLRVPLAVLFRITQPDVWTLGCGFNLHRRYSS